jgi:CMP/dCMP kinase
MRIQYNFAVMELSKQKKHIITVAGRPGGGKSTAAKGIASRLGFEHLSGGDLYRKFGKERGLDILQANLANEATGEIDRLVDDKLRDINDHGDRMVIDSRTAWHFIPTSFKVFLDVDLQTAAKRILAGMDEARKKSENIPSDPRQYAKQLNERSESEIRRYKTLYSIDPFNKRNFDLIINTSSRSVDDVLEEIVARFNDWIKS